MTSRRDIPPRYVPELPFPPYTYTPGVAPHPVSDPAGHAFGKEHQRPTAIEPTRWRESREFLFAVDLFNYGYYWEAHEVWESLWLSAGRSGLVADFLKGLIKLAAAGVKLREGRAVGVQRHTDRARQLFQGVQASAGMNSFLGLSFPALLAICDQLNVVSPPPVGAEPRAALPPLALEMSDP